MTVGPGDRVEAGTENLQSLVKVRATASPADTRLAEITSAVAEASKSRTPVVQLANRIGGWFVIVVLGLATVTLAIWLTLDPDRAVSSAVALLIVACPCALALATPLAVAVSIGRLARRGVLIREGDCLERLHKPGTLWFDKTGTLTEGRMRVVEWFGDRATLPAVAAIESQLNHPIARAVCEHAGAEPNSPLATNVSQSLGRGVSGTVKGHHYTVGGFRGSIESAGDAAEIWNQRADYLKREGASPIAVQCDDELVALFGVADEIRAESAAVVAQFQCRGWQVGLLSGDDQATVDRVAGALGIAPSWHAVSYSPPTNSLPCGLRPDPR